MNEYRQAVTEGYELIDGIRAYYGLELEDRNPKKRINYKLIAIALVVFITSCAMTL